VRRSVVIDGRRLSYREAGTGLPVVLLHAFPLNADMWAPQLAAVPEGIRLIAPDLQGFGASEPEAAAARLPRSVDEHAADVVALLDRLGLDRAVVGGLSMGGYVTFAVYRRSPARVRAVVLADTRAVADTDEGRAARRRLQAQVDEEGVGAVVRELLPKLLSAETHRRRPDLVAAIQRLIEAASPLAVTAALECLRTRPDSTALLPSLRRPALVLVGADDALTPVAESERMHAALPTSRLVVIPQAGHLSNLEQPDAFNAALFDFLRTLPV
jgi:3-oxoadipate enol-lactonase